MTFIETDTLEQVIDTSQIDIPHIHHENELEELVSNRFMRDNQEVSLYGKYIPEDTESTKDGVFTVTFLERELGVIPGSDRYLILQKLCNLANLPLPEDEADLDELLYSIIFDKAQHTILSYKTAYNLFHSPLDKFAYLLSVVEEPQNSDSTLNLEVDDMSGFNFTLKGRWEDPQKLSLLMLGLMGYQKANAVMQVLALETCGTRYPELNGKTLAEYIDEITPEYGYDAPMFAVAAIVEPRLQQRRQEAEAFQTRVDAQKERGIDVGNLTMEERFRTQLEGMVAVAQQHQQGNDKQENEAFQVVQEQSKMLGWIAYDDIPEKRPPIEVKYNRQTTEQFAGMIADLRTRYPSLEEEAIMAGLLSLHGLDYSPSVETFLARIEELDPENSTELLNLTHEQMAVLLAKEMEIRTRPAPEGQDPAEVQSTEPQPAEQHLLKVAAALQDEERYFVNIQEKTGGYLLTLQEQPDGSIEAFPCEDNAEAMDTVLAETGQLVERFLPVQPVLPEPLEEEMMLAPPFFPPFEPQPLPGQPVPVESVSAPEEASGRDITEYTDSKSVADQATTFEDETEAEYTSGEPATVETPDLPAPPWYIQRPERTALEVSLPDVQEREPRTVSFSSAPAEPIPVAPVRIPPAMPVSLVPVVADVPQLIGSEVAVVQVPSERRGQPVAEVEERVIVPTAPKPVERGFNQPELDHEPIVAPVIALEPAPAREPLQFRVQTSRSTRKTIKPALKPASKLPSPSEPRPAAITEPVSIPEPVQPALQESQPRLVEARTSAEVAVEEVAQIERRYEVGSVVSAAFAAIEAVQESVVQEQALQEAFGTQTTEQTQMVLTENAEQVQNTTRTEQATTQSAAHNKVVAEAAVVLETTTQQRETITTSETQTATSQWEAVRTAQAEKTVQAQETIQTETAPIRTAEATGTTMGESSRTTRTQVTAEATSQKDAIEVSSQVQTPQAKFERDPVEVSTQTPRDVASELNVEAAPPVAAQSSIPVAQEARTTGAVNGRTFGSTRRATTSHLRNSGSSTEAVLTTAPGIVNSEGNGGGVTTPAETKGASEEVQEQGTYEQRQKHQTSAAQQTALQQSKTQQYTRDQARATLQMLKQPPRGVLNSPRLLPARPNSVNVAKQIRRTLSASNAAALEPGKVELHMLSQAFQQSCVTANCPLTNLVVNRFKNNGQRCHLQQSDIDTFVQGNASWFQRRSSVQLVHLIDESGRPVRTPAVAIATGTTRKEVKSALEQPLRQDQLPPNVKIIPSTFALSA